jgi:hypothetical protein
MALSIPLNIARMTTVTTGTGTVTLGSAVGGYLDFASAGATDGMQLSYGIVDYGVSPNAHEVGYGTYTASGTTLTRTLTKSSTGSLLSLSGNAHVFVSLRAEDIYNTFETLGQLFAINTQTASYTLVLTDAGKTVEMNVASANTLTVPPNSSVPFPLNTYLNIVQYGAGLTTLTQGSGVTIRSRNGLKMGGQYAAATLYKRGADEWVASGDTST